MKRSPLNVYGVPVNRRKRIPCRCNKCGTRKTLSKYPEEYRFGFRKCVLGHCSGLMKVDRFRLQAQYDPAKRDKDSGKQCQCHGHPRMHPLGRINIDYGYCCEHASEQRKGEFVKLMQEEHQSQEAYYESLG